MGALNRKQALTAAQEIFNGPRAAEADRLSAIAEAMRPPHQRIPRVEMPKKPTDAMKNLAYKAQTAILSTVVDVFAQNMKVDGYRAGNSGQDAAAWAFWQRNGLDARQTGITRGAVTYGASYVRLDRGDRAPIMRGRSPLQVTAMYRDPSYDEWPMLALMVEGPMVTLTDEEQDFVFGVERRPQRSAFGEFGLEFDATSGLSWEFIESRPHGFNEVPIVRFRDRWLLEGEEQFGIVEPLLGLQDRLDETMFGLMVAQYYQAFRQRYVIGWVPQDEQEVLKASAQQVWVFENPAAKVGDLPAGDPEPYLKSKDSTLGEIAATAQVPPQQLGPASISNIGAETVAALKAGHDAKSSEIMTSLGESWEQALRGAAYLDGDMAGAEDFSSQVRWQDLSGRSLAQTVDALGKMSQMLDVPSEMLWEKIPGWSDTDVARAKSLAAAGDSLGELMATLNRQAGDSAVNG